MDRLRTAIATACLTLASFGASERAAAQAPAPEKPVTTTPIPNPLEGAGFNLNILAPRAGKVDGSTQESNLPERVVKAAQEKGVSLSLIKYEDRNWVICDDTSCQILLPATDKEVREYGKQQPITGLIAGDVLTIMRGGKTENRTIDSDPNDFKIPGLGTFAHQKDRSVTFTPDESFEGTVKVTKKSGAKTAPGKAPSGVSEEIQYTPERLRELSATLINNPDTTYIVVISVPKLCPPCRDYKEDIRQTAGKIGPNENTKIITLNLPDFDTARRVVGNGFLPVPSTVILQAPNDKPTVIAGGDLQRFSSPFFDPLKRRCFRLPAGRHSPDTLIGAAQAAKELADGAVGSVFSFPDDLFTKLRQ